MLPATGAPVSRHRTSKMKEMFDEYVRIRTRENWKFWIVSFFSLYCLNIQNIDRVISVHFACVIIYTHTIDSVLTVITFLNQIISLVYCWNR